MRLKLPLGLNPIIVKDLRSRMRGARAFVILTSVLLLLGGVSYTLYRIVLATSRFTGSPLSPQIGQTLFFAIAVLELMMVCFITPAVSAGAISGEREKLTYEMLLATPLRPASILWGKLISALSYVFLLIFAAVPMASLVFIFGGVSPRDMVKALVILLAVTVMLGVVGVFMSAWLGRTARATVLSYLIVLGLLIGPVFLVILVGILRQDVPPRWILVPNPLSALFSALIPSPQSGGSPLPFLGELGMIVGGDWRAMMGPSNVTGIPRPLYHYTLPFYGLITLGLYLLATRLIRPTHRWRIGWKAALTALALFLLLGGGVAAAFVFTADRYEKASVSAVPTPMPAIFEVEREIVAPIMIPPPVPVSPLPTPTPAVSPTLSEDDQVAIYAAVVRQLYAVDHTFAEPPNFQVVYLLRRTDDGVGDPDAPRAPSQVLPEPVQKGVIGNLADLPAELLWVDGRDQVPLDDNFSVEGNGVVITLGNIHIQKDGSTLVSASLYFAELGAGGRTYVVGQVDGVWQVTGDTGVEWMS